MSNRKIVLSDRVSKPRVPLSQAVIANGMVYVSGTTPFDLERKMAPGFAEQMHQVMRNITAILEEAGSALDQIVKTNVYLTHIEDYAEMNQIYASYFEEGNYPARTTIEAPMSIPNILLEIECVAAVKHPS